MIEAMQIPAEAYQYLVHQRGSIWRYREWPGEWRRRYLEQLAATYELIRPWLPELLYPHILDVGCGMGGIDFVLHQHYGSGASFALIDGDCEPAPVVRHGEPSGSVWHAMAFLVANGIPECQLQAFVAPPCNLDRCEPIDLVISLQAWCFHFAPAPYLERILARRRKNCRFILDVRANRPQWRWELERRICPSERIATLEKSELLVFAP